MRKEKKAKELALVVAIFIMKFVQAPVTNGKKKKEEKDLHFVHKQ